MQIHLTLHTDKPFIIPLNYHYNLQSAIYSKLSEIGVSDFWHDCGFGDKRKFKAFVFGPLLGKYSIKEKSICFENEILLEVRSPIFEFCDELQRSIELNPFIKLYDTTLSVSNMELTNTHINAEQVMFSALSPIIIHSTAPDGRTIFYSPEEPEFAEGIKKNYNNKFDAIYGTDAPELNIQLKGNSKKAVTNYKGIWLTGYKCRFLVSAPPQALELLYNCGLGTKNSQGFGLVDIF